MSVVHVISAYCLHLFNLRRISHVNKGNEMCYYLHVKTYPTSSEVWSWNLSNRGLEFSIIPGTEIAQAVTLQRLWSVIF